MTDINITQEEIKITKENKNYTLNYEGEVVKFDANYPEAQEAARIAVEKAIEIEGIVAQGTEDFNANATLKTNAFNQNAEDKTNAFDSNATSRTNSFNSNATEKTNAYNSNASDKVAAYNENASTKTTTFNNNVTSKTYDFNANASEKTSAFNDNYTAKKALIDAEVQVAKDWATKTDGTVDGVDYSAKYYAQSILPIKDDITTVAGIATDVSDVADIKDEVTAVANDKANIDTVADDITNVNTVAGDHANIQTVINNMTAINNAPTYANNSKIWAEGLDGEVAPLGGTHSSKGWAEIAEQAASGVQNPANRDLSNLTNTGQMIIDSQNGTISNCILEIPQNLKLEDNGSGTITLKSGSVITLSGSTYRTITTTQDYVFNDTGGYANRNYYLFLFPSELGRVEFSQATSGDTDSLAGVINHIWFDTTNKVINHYTDTSTTPARTLPYPLAVINRQGETFYKIIKDSNGNDMIFNGAGFIGHHAFVYPNVSGLLPKGFNTDGTLKSTKATTSALSIIELSVLFHGLLPPNIFIYSNGAVGGVFHYEEVKTIDELQNLPYSYIHTYVSDNNLIYVWNGSQAQLRDGTPFIEYSYNGTSVTDFAIKQPVRLATNEMLDKVQSQVDTNTTAISGKQDTLVSGTNIKTINSTSVLGSGNFTLADQSLSNLDSTGQMVVDSQNGIISNCILEIPQNLKLTLENSVLTIKAGSEVVVADGDTYTTQTVNQDVSRNFSTWGGDGLFYILFRTNNTLTMYNVSKTGSGATLPEDETTYNRFYLTTDKKLYEYYSERWNPSPSSYPLCVVEKTGTSLTFAKDSKGRDMIFNGAGFIGQHIFLYPNVKGLVPNGRNANGTLKNIKFTTNSLMITDTFNGNNIDIIINGNTLTRTTGATYYPDENYNRTPNGIWYVCFAGKFKRENGVITDFVFYQPYEGARNLLTDDIEEEIATKQVDVTTLTGYDATQTQTLKNINGVLTWVTD